MTILDGLASLKPGSFHIYYSGGFAFATDVWTAMDSCVIASVIRVSCRARARGGDKFCCDLGSNEYEEV